MPEREDYILVAQFLRDGVQNLMEEQAKREDELGVDPKPRTPVNEALSSLIQGLEDITAVKNALRKAIDPNLNDAMRQPRTFGDHRPLLEAVSQIVSRVGELYRIERRLHRMNPPRLLEGCFGQLHGLGDWFAGRLRILADHLEGVARDAATTGRVEYEFDLNAESRMDQLQAEIARVKEIIQEVREMGRASSP